MNDRINLLASKCFDPRRRPESSIYFDMQKFAELIVAECAAEADKCAERGSWMAGYRIKQHFGLGIK